jgi:hypothetical protein
MATSPTVAIIAGGGQQHRKDALHQGCGLRRYRRQGIAAIDDVGDCKEDQVNRCRPEKIVDGQRCIPDRR